MNHAILLVVFGTLLMSADLLSLILGLSLLSWP
jgi:hypothetical protein